MKLKSEELYVGNDRYLYQKIYKMSDEFQKIKDFRSKKFAIQKNGGPIAVTQNKDFMFLQNSNSVLSNSNIVFYSNSGEFISKCALSQRDLKQKIVAFDFIEDEKLLVLFQDGQYYLIDPSDGDQKIHSLGLKFQTDPIQEAKVVDNGFVFYNIKDEKQVFYYIENPYDPFLNIFDQFKVPSKTQPLSFVPISPKSPNEQIQLAIVHPDAGYILLSLDSQQIFYNQLLQCPNTASDLPNIPQVKKIQISSDFDKFALLSQQGDQFFVHMVPFNNELSDYSCINAEIISLPDKILWCSPNCVALVFPDEIYLTSSSGNSNFSLYKKHRKQNLFAIQEVDGIKLISFKGCGLIRLIPCEYLNVFGLDEEPGQKLFKAYESFENKTPLSDQDIRSDQDQLNIAVNECIKAAEFELNQENLRKLLMAASFGKAFLGTSYIDDKQLKNTCQYLKVVNQINIQLNQRTITYTQLQKIDEEILIKIILRYKKHFLAYNVCQYLDFSSNLLTNTLVNWACCKLKNSTLPDDELVAVISKKLQNFKDISYTDIAHKAHSNGKKNMAIKLLELEPNIKKKVPILLWMESYEKAIIDSINSKDSNLIYMVIIKFVDSLWEISSIHNLLQQNYITQRHTIFYYKYFNQENLLNYFIHHQQFYDMAMFYISNDYQKLNIDKKIESYKTALSSIKRDKNKNKYLETYFKHQITNLTECKDNNIRDDMTITERLIQAIQNKNQDEEKRLIKEYEIPDRRVFILKIQNYIKNNQFDELEKKCMEKNKNQQLVTNDIIGHLLLKAGNSQLAINYLSKISNIDDRLRILKHKGFYKEAVRNAMDNNEYQFLEEISNEISDQNILQDISMFLQNRK